MVRPNVLFMMADQFHAGCLSVLGSQARTPNLDRLAADGVRFQRAYCNNPICTPSRISFMTGQYPHTHGIFGLRAYELDDDNPDTLGAVFRRSGYQTALIGKSHMIRTWDRAGFEHIRYCDLIDCDKNDPLDNDYFRYLVQHEIADAYDLTVMHRKDPAGSKRGMVSEIPAEHSVERWTADESLAFLRGRDRSRPFFLKMSFQRPHPPLTIPAGTELLYDPDRLQLPYSAKDLFEHRFAGKPETIRSLLNRRGGSPYVPEDEGDLKLQLAYYFSLITIIDEQIGRVIDELHRSGDDRETIVVFTADHGDLAGEHGMLLKNSGIYEAVHRIPFILKYPGGPAGAVSDQCIESVDLYPTLCDLCGIAAPACVEGRSVLPLVQARGQGKPFAVCEFEFPGYTELSPKHTDRINAIRDDRYRLVYYGAEHSGELYDYGRDPHELDNVYDHPDYRHIRLSLLERLFDHINRYRVKWSAKDDREAVNQVRNTLVYGLHFGGRSWSEIKPFYRPSRNMKP